MLRLYSNTTDAELAAQSPTCASLWIVATEAHRLRLPDPWQPGMLGVLEGQQAQCFIHPARKIVQDAADREADEQQRLLPRPFRKDVLTNHR
jgi:hypothetical protein